MAESKRRSDVKPFVHRTQYPRLSRPSQPSLFGNGLNNIRQEWVCTCKSNAIPSAGSTVLVRAHLGRKPDVLWGNQIVAEVTDALANELADVLSGSEHAGGVVATIMSGADALSRFAIKLETRQ